MKKRLIDCTARELAAYTKEDLLRAITESEGRVLATETIGTVDVNHPIIQGLPDVAPEDTIREIKRLTGKMVAINLEPVAYVPKSSQEEESVWDLTSGRCATVENAKKAADMGVDMIILTGNPGIGVENQAIIHALTQLKEAVGDRVILTAGKMHASGIASEAGENILTPELFRASLWSMHVP